MRPFQEFEVWQAAHRLVLDVYRATDSFPDSEQYGLQSQMRRAAASVPTNIAEGSARTDREFRNFLRIALGSATELEYHLILARDLGYLTTDAHEAFVSPLASLKRQLQAFIQTSVRSAGSGQRPTANGQRRAPGR